MRYIFVSDIFGRTDALERLASRISGNVEIVDPYQSKPMGFADEAEAYSVFTQEVGLKRYSEMLLNHLIGFSDAVRLIGFSVGGSAIWNCSESGQLPHVVDAQCFYSSQIRHAVNTQPRFPTRLIFPAHEEHFSVSDLMALLQSKNNVTIEQTRYLHGFMNRYSKNYDPEGYEEFCQQLCND
ncbi:dienelactone hydrolase family protein [Litoribrevibacter albus]|uniref:Dienelactone hydrolase n=1 Tax=Litoribrevibacter albus TaxID=1473156 RepID=A0AA37S965_9GAMM|nr:dienelactone hydrolase family protein [Litoribrevibacter albus]GLQ30906.1 dienelactone hydrolase [Litoribrevibacter albus]